MAHFKMQYIIAISESNYTWITVHWQFAIHVHINAQLCSEAFYITVTGLSLTGDY